MTSSLHQATDLDSSAAGDSVASSPRSDIHAPSDSRVRFMCSFGGKILPRPHDNLLRYVGGETRMVAVHRSTAFSSLVSKLAKLSGIPAVAVKYQLPNEDLDALISVSTDEDVENMMEEYDRVALNQNPRSARLRMFLFPKGELDHSRTSSISSLLDGSTNREHWFFDALNSGRSLERGRSEASSIVSEMPDYLFGLENSDENHPQSRGGGEQSNKLMRNKLIFNDNVSASDPGSPAPVVSSSPYCSTSSVAAPPTPSVSSIPDLPPVKTKPDPVEPVVVRRQLSEPIPEAQLQPQQPPAGYAMHYIPDQSHYSGPAAPVQHIPVYYVPGQGNVPVQQQVQYGRAQYVQQYSVPQAVGYHQVPGPGMGQQVPGQGMGQQVPGQGMGQVYARPAMDPYEGVRMVSDGMNQQVYYGVRSANAAVMTGPPGHPGMVMAGAGEEMMQQRGVVDPKSGRVSGP